MNSQGLLIGATMGWQDQLQEGMKLPERSGSLADDPFRGRHLTSHERMTGLPWDASYQDGRAPWDIEIGRAHV